MADGIGPHSTAPRAEAVWALVSTALTVGTLGIIDLLVPGASIGRLLAGFANQAAPLCVLATALTMLLRVGILDVGQLGIAGLASAIIGALVEHGVPLAFVLCAIAGVGALYGLVGGALETSLSLPASLAVAFGVYFGSQVLSWIILDDGPVNVGGPYAALGAGTFLGVPALLWAALLPCAAAAFAMPGRAHHRTPIGDRRREVVIAHVAGGVLAALAGLLLTAQVQSASPEMTPDPGPALAAALAGGASLYGGRGSLLTALTGAAFATAVQTGLTFAAFRPFVIWGALGLLATLCFGLDASLRRGARG